MEENTDEEGKENSSGLGGCYLTESVYLRQGLHNGVQQSSHPHRHLQELQYCRDTHTRKMKKRLTNIKIVQSYIREQGLLPSRLL